jgi:hypothetical protein
MFKKVKVTIENKRNNGFFLWKILVYIKDFIHPIKERYKFKKKVRLSGHVASIRSQYAHLNDKHLTINQIRIKKKNFFVGKRLDLVVKYLFLKKDLVGLYEKHILHRTNGIEPKDPYGSGGYKKNDVSDYSSSFRKLYESIDSNGFDKKHPVPLYKKSLFPANGAHRIAAADFVGVEPEVVYFEEGIGTSWGEQEFPSDTFNQKERMQILHQWCKLNEDFYNVMVVYDPCIKYEDIIKKELKNNGFNVVGSETLTLDDCFEKWVKNLYAFEWTDFNQEVINTKISHLNKHQKRVKVFVLESANPIQKLLLLKKEIRQKIPLKYENFTSFHTPDSYEEREYVLGVTLSAVFWKNFALLNSSKIKQLHLEHFFTLKDKLENQSLSPSSVCIAGGAVMDVFGLRQTSGDVDLIVDSKIREHLSDDCGELAEDVDVVMPGYLSKDITDDEIIYDSDNHFYYFGFKVLDIDLFYSCKSRASRKKDKKDVLLLDEMLNV